MADHLSANGSKPPAILRALNQGDMCAYCDHVGFIAQMERFGHPRLQVHVRGFDRFAGQGFDDLTIQFCHVLTTKFVIHQ